MPRTRPTARRTVRSRLRPSLDRLEGRALMAGAGSLDPTFGGGLGYYSGPINTGSGAMIGALPNPVSIVVESDSSTIVAFPDAGTGGQTYGVSHLKADGTLDTSFGVAGKADVVLPAGFTAVGGPASLLVQADGKILLVGTSYYAPTTASPTETVVARLDADGTVDSSFGTDGVVVIDQSTFGVTNPRLFDAALQTDGKIVLSGYTQSTDTFADIPTVVARLDSNGAVDTTFGTNGLVTFADADPERSFFETPEGLVIQPDGRIVVLARISGGTFPSPQYYIPELLRLDANGSMDTSLSQIGITSAELDPSQPDGLILQPNGQFLVLGTTNDGTATALARINADGSLDATKTVPISFTSVQGFALEPDGRIAITGTYATSFSTIATAVYQLRPSLNTDTSFGTHGLAIPAIPATMVSSTGTLAETVTFDPSRGMIVLAAAASFTTQHGGYYPPSDYEVARLVPPPLTPIPTTPGDFTGDGISDPAVYLAQSGEFAIGDSSGLTPGQIIPFGTAGAGQSIPAPGDYYGTGQDDVAVYLVNQGVYAIQDPTGKTFGKLLPFGTPGAGQTIPAPGDYYNTGQDDVAVYLAASGAFAILDPTGKPAGAIIPFGVPGVGASIPVPGDYDGSGHTELAVYVPSTATFYYRSNLTGKDVAVPFGAPGLGVSLPMPGDYDGSGKTEVAVYVPSTGTFYYRPAAGGADVAIPFGTPGLGQTIPDPGDYTGSGHTELGVYLTGPGSLAYRPANGGNDLIMQFGLPGFGQSIPVTSTVLIPFPGSGSGSGDAFGLANVVGGLDPLDFIAAKKPKSGLHPA